MSGFGPLETFDGGAINPPEEGAEREHAFEDWQEERVLDTDLEGVSLCCDCFMPPLKTAGRWRGLAGLVRDEELCRHWQEKHEGEGAGRDPDDEYDRRVEADQDREDC